MWSVASHVLKHELRGVKRYPLVLMLEPLLRCNLACAGCGKIQHPKDVLRRQLTPDQCFAAVEQCDVPVVSIPGGEPLLHPQIDEIVAGLVERRKYVYLCTNALKLEASLERFRPSKYLTFSVHLDGPREVHDRSVCRHGVYDVAVRAIRAAVRAGFRVTTNSTVYETTAAEKLPAFFDEMMRLGVEGMMISPGYAYEKAPDQEHFLSRERTIDLFHRTLAEMRRRGWRFNQTPLYLEFLQGRWDLDCAPWGNPTYNVFGWQRPCYLLDEGSCDSFAELMKTTDWAKYGHAGGNPKCRDCLVHSGFEPSAVAATFGSWRGLLATTALSVLGRLPGQRERRRPPSRESDDNHRTGPPPARPKRDREERELTVLS
jgi:hopanoid biosynthesis associated radical SAM protein HpnH